jgi:hypothetical protein
MIVDNIIANGGIAGVAVLELGYHPGPRNITIKGNSIGTNGNHGILLAADVANVLVQSNKIANNIGFGVSIRPRIDASGTYTPRGVTILSNSIYNNGRLGIDLNTLTFVNVPTDLNTDGPSLNDVFDADAGPNGGQNFPLIDGQRSFINPALVQVWGSFSSKANQEYLIQIFANQFADSSGYGEGQLLIGEGSVRTDSNGQAKFSFPAALSASVLNGTPATILTATATDLTTGDTSEFSAFVNVDVRGNPTAFERPNIGELFTSLDGIEK